jgi:hypothetical protein
MPVFLTKSGVVKRILTQESNDLSSNPVTHTNSGAIGQETPRLRASVFSFKVEIISL